MLMILGSICAAGYGCAQPGLSLIMGELVDAFSLPRTFYTHHSDDARSS